MMSGVPAAAVRETGGHCEIIVHEENGLLTRRDEWEGAVKRLLEQRELLQRMAGRAIRSVGPLYSLDSMIDRVGKLYLSLINRPS
jgi:glycosyltransferase involved in cell wall biosynthesis